MVRAARSYRDLDDLNAQTTQWCETQAANRHCPEDKTKSVRDVFQDEQPRLIAIPDNPFPVHETETVYIGKTPYARFDFKTKIFCGSIFKFRAVFFFGLLSSSASYPSSEKSV